MRFFKRGDAAPQDDFWTWWAGAQDRVAHAIETDGFDRRLVDEISRAVQGLDPRLAWELSAGRSAKHALTVSPEGNAAVRPIAIRWLAAAPPPDATWEYHASRQPAASLAVLEIDGKRMDLSETRAITSWDASRRRLDVGLWHPAFEAGSMELRQQVSFLFLDNLLGEEDVERWIGQIDTLEAPTSGRTPDELREEVVRRAAEPPEGTWVLGQRTDPRGRVDIVLVNAALKRIDHPLADQHVAIRIPIEGGGMPDEAQSALVNAEEDRMVDVLGDAAVLVGHSTGPGERVIHFVAADLERVKAGIDAWARDAPEWRIKVDFAHDPDWQFQRDLGGR